MTSLEVSGDNVSKRKITQYWRPMPETIKLTVNNLVSFHSQWGNYWDYKINHRDVILCVELVCGLVSSHPHPQIDHVVLKVCRSYVPSDHPTISKSVHILWHTFLSSGPTTASCGWQQVSNRASCLEHFSSQSLQTGKGWVRVRASSKLQ